MSWVNMSYESCISKFGFQIELSHKQGMTLHSIIILIICMLIIFGYVKFIPTGRKSSLLFYGMDILKFLLMKVNLVIVERWIEYNMEHWSFFDVVFLQLLSLFVELGFYLLKSTPLVLKGVSPYGNFGVFNFSIFSYIYFNVL